MPKLLFPFICSYICLFSHNNYTSLNGRCSPTNIILFSITIRNIDHRYCILIGILEISYK